MTRNSVNLAKNLYHFIKDSKPQKPIVLVGSAGSGKSTVGKRVARKIGLQFYDSDSMIEEREGMTVLEIYEKHGKDYFEKREKDVIEEILSSYGAVLLSTGSNSFINDTIHDLIKDHSITIWLYADPKILEERISRRNNRPGFTPENTQDLLREVVDLHYPIYSKADISVESHEQNIYKVVDTVILKLKNYFDGLLN